MHQASWLLKFPQDTFLLFGKRKWDDWLLHADCDSSVWYSSQRCFVLTCFMLSLIVHSEGGRRRSFWLKFCRKSEITQSGFRSPFWLLCEHWHWNLSSETSAHLAVRHTDFTCDNAICHSILTWTEKLSMQHFLVFLCHFLDSRKKGETEKDATFLHRKVLGFNKKAETGIYNLFSL